LNLPDLAITPLVTALGAEDAAETLSTAYNGGLENALSQLDQLPGIRIARMDIFTILNDAVEHPEDGLTNVKDSCITPGVLAGAVCLHPNTYLFWDYIHPATQAHRLLGQKAEAILQQAFASPQSVAGAQVQ
jgi:phospholipase/lecithinase/hemolysin